MNLYSLQFCFGVFLIACGGHSTQVDRDAATVDAGPAVDAAVVDATPAADDAPAADASPSPDAATGGSGGSTGPSGICPPLGPGLTCSYPFCITEGYTVTDLGILAGDVESRAQALDDSGNVAGTLQPLSVVAEEAFRWSTGDGLVHLGTLGGNTSRGHGVSGGRVVGGADITSGDSHAFLSDDQGSHDLGTLGGAESIAHGINAAGVVVGESRLASGAVRPTRFQNGVASDLGTLAGTLTSGGTALAIHASGVIVGKSDTADGRSHATRWDNGTVVDLGTIGLASSVASAVNANGDAAGTLVAVNTVQPARFVGGAVIAMGNPPGIRGGGAAGINDAGVVVGTMVGGGIEVRIAYGFVFDGTSQIKLDDLQNRRSDGLRWERIIEASAINNAGQIAGQGYDGTGRPRAVLLTPHCVPASPLRSLTFAGGTTVDAPAGLAAGDFLLAALTYRGDPQAFAPPAGWSLVVDQPAGAGTDQAFHALVYSHVATAAEPAQYTFAPPDGVQVDVQIAAYREVSQVDAVASATLGGEPPLGTAINAPNLTTTQDNVVLIGIFFDSAGGTWTKSLGMRGQQTVRSNFHGVSLQDELRATAGPTSDRTSRNIKGALAAISIVLR